MNSLLFVCFIVYCYIVPGKASVMKRSVIFATNKVSSEDTFPLLSNVEIFRIPRVLRINETITLTAELRPEKYRESATINLLKSSKRGDPDYSNVLCQVKMEFPNNESGKTSDSITINSITNGVETVNDENTPVTDVILVPEFTIIFWIMESKKIALNLNKSYPISHDCTFEELEDIAYLTLGGDISKVDSLSFDFHEKPK